MTSAPGPGPTTTSGQPAPDFSTRNQHGEVVSRSDLRGAPAVLLFYPWAFSRICRGELAAIRDHHDRLTAAGTRVLAISCDSMFTLRAYAEAEGIGFDLLTDHWPHGAIASAYRVFDADAGCALRATFVLDAEGVIRWRAVSGIGEPRDLAPVLDQVAA